MLCLLPELANKLKKAIKDGSINTDKLLNATSEARRKFFAKIIGEESAKEVNLLFEKKILLKNQEKAMYDWAREITGLSKSEKEAILAKIKQTLADKKERLLNPKENEQFLNEITSDVYSKKYKTDVSLEEAQRITELTQEIKTYKDKMNSDFTWKNKEDGINYGAAKVALNNYISLLKLEANKRPFINPFKQKGIGGKVGAIGQDALLSIRFIAQNSRAIVASMDNSFFGRQGIKALLNPRTTAIWAKDWIKSWGDMYKVIKGGNKAGDAVLDGVMAEIYSRENYLNGRYEMGKKLDIGTGEEAYPTSAPSRLGEIKYVGKVLEPLARLFRASEVAYEAGAMRLRADIADKFYSMAEKMGRDLTDKLETGSINELVNSMTGRGRIPTSEGVQKILNEAFFSVKFFKSNVDFLTLHAGSKMSSFARQQAAINLVSVVATTGVILGIAKALNPNSVDFDPRSSKFGKIQIGKNLTIDITGGASGIVVLLSKILSQSSKSATSGIVSKLSSGYGSQTGMSLLWQFTENKFSPLFGVIRDLVEQQTFSGGKPTIQGELGGLITPITIQNISQFKGESGAIQLIGLIADGLGLNANAYTSSTDWGESTSKELQQFKQKVGDTKFKEANDLFNQKYNDWFSNVVNKDTYKALSGEQKQKVITNKKSEIKSSIFKQYQFKYKQEKQAKTPKL